MKTGRRGGRKKNPKIISSKKSNFDTFLIHGKALKDLRKNKKKLFPIKLGPIKPGLITPRFIRQMHFCDGVGKMSHLKKKS